MTPASSLPRRASSSASAARTRTPDGFTLYAYAAVQALAAAAEATGTLDSTRLAEWLRGGNRFDTVVGAVSFDAKGDLTNPAIAWFRWIDGRYVEVDPKTLQPPTHRHHPLIPEPPPMRAFFVQIKCELGKSYDVATAIADAEIASEIYSTAGGWDLLVKFYLKDGEDVGQFVSHRIQTIPGIRDTYTLITFKAF